MKKLSVALFVCSTALSVVSCVDSNYNLGDVNDQVSTTTSINPPEKKNVALNDVINDNKFLAAASDGNMAYEKSFDSVIKVNEGETIFPLNTPEFLQEGSYKLTNPVLTLMVQNPTGQPIQAEVIVSRPAVTKASDVETSLGNFTIPADGLLNIVNNANLATFLSPIPSSIGIKVSGDEALKGLPILPSINIPMSIEKGGSVTKSFRLKEFNLNLSTEGLDKDKIAAQKINATVTIENNTGFDITINAIENSPIKSFNCPVIVARKKDKYEIEVVFKENFDIDKIGNAEVTLTVKGTETPTVLSGSDSFSVEFEGQIRAQIGNK